MATYSSVIDGLRLFMERQGDSHSISAEHDQLYAGSNENLTDEDREHLEQSGWLYDEDVESWMKFV